MTPAPEAIDQLRQQARSAADSLPPVEYPTAKKNPPVARCNSCQAPIWWGETAAGKRCPFNWDLVTATPTNESHFRTCKDAKRWSKKGRS